MKQEAIAVKEKFGDDRRTEIETISGEMDIEDLIPDEECMLTLTEFGYVKRQNPDVYRTQRRGGRGVSGMTRREEDVATEMFVIGTHDYVMFFTNLGRAYRLKCYEIPEGSRTEQGHQHCKPAAHRAGRKSHVDDPRAGVRRRKLPRDGHEERNH